MTEDEGNAIVLAVANRRSVRDIAKTYGITETEVNATVDQRAADMFDGAKLRRKMFLEDVRLEALGARGQALTTGCSMRCERDAQDGDAIGYRNSERKKT